MRHPKAHIHDITTGIVRVTITGDDSVVSLNTLPGESVYYGDIDPARHKIVNGKPEEMPAEGRIDTEPDKWPDKGPDISYGAFLRAIADGKEKQFYQLVKDTLDGSGVHGVRIRGDAGRN